jgi:hypothetical protein
MWASASGDDVWSAVLKVTGNPIKVLDRYMSQARDLGFNMTASCDLYYSDGPSVPPSDTLRTRGLLRLTCRAIGSASEEATTGAAALTIELRRSAGDAPYDDYILLQFARSAAGIAPGLERSGATPTLPAEWATGVPGPPEPPKLSTTGQPIRRVDPPAARPIRVVKGTRLLAPPGVPCIQRGGFDAVFEVRGNIDQVLDGYAAQFRSIDMRTERSTTQFRGREARIDEGVGETGNYGAVAVEGTKKNTAYLHLWLCPTQ